MSYKQLPVAVSEAITTVPDLAALSGIVDPLSGEIRYVESEGQLYAYNGATWDVVGGGVSSPGTTTDNAVVRWDGVDGSAIQDSGVALDDSDNLSGVNVLTVAVANITDNDLITNFGGSDASAEGGGLLVQRTSDQGGINYADALASHWTAGKTGDFSEIITADHIQTMVEKTVKGVAGAVTQVETTGTFTSSFTDNTGDNTFFGQTFTTTVAGNLTDVRFDTTLSGSTGGTVSVDIYATDVGGAPTGAVLGSSDAIAHTSVTNGGYTIFTFSSPVALSNGVKYAAVINNLITGTSLGIRFNNTNPYGAGDAVYTTDGGSNWTVDGSVDCRFTSTITGAGTAALKFDGTTSGTLDMAVPAAVTSYTLTWPAVQGGSGEVLKNDGSGNLFWGPDTAGIANVVEDTTPQLGGDLDLNGNDIVDGAAFIYRQSPSNSLYFGTNAGSGSTANNNTGIGTTSLDAITTGFNNTGVGHNAGGSISIGDRNTLVGATTGDNITQGNDNTAVGNNALGATSTGSNNTAVGSSALSSSNGSGQTAVGYSALTASSTAGTAVGYLALQVATGSGNTAVGYQAGDGVLTGASNTIIGRIADVNAGSENFAIALGYNAIVDASNKMRIGAATVESQTITTVELSRWNTTIQLDEDSVVDAVAAGSLTIKSSSKTAGTGDGGDINLTPGTSVGGNQGSVIINHQGTGGNAARIISGTNAGDGLSIAKDGVNDAINVTFTGSSSGKSLQVTHFPTATQAAQILTAGGPGLEVRANSATSTAPYIVRLYNNNTTTDQVLLDFKTPGGEIGIKAQAAAFTSYDLRLPTAQGGAGEFLQNDGAGNLSWAASSGISAVVDDTNPDLGGDLNLSGFKIVDGTTNMLYYLSAISTAYGGGAGDPSTTGSGNTGFGKDAAATVTNGTNNTAVGFRAGQSLGGGDRNTIVGSFAGDTIASGNDNTAIGQNALSATNSASGNTGIGRNAGLTNAFGDNNTYVGNLADGTTNNLDNSMAIGYNAKVDASNKIRFGDDNVTAVEFPPSATVTTNIIKATGAAILAGNDRGTTSTDQTLTSTDARTQSMAPSASHNVDLPSTGVLQGEVFTIINRAAAGTLELTVRSSDTTALDTFAAGFIKVVALQDTPTTGAHWHRLEIFEEYEYSPNFTFTGGASCGTEVVRITRHNDSVSLWIGQTIQATNAVNPNTGVINSDTDPPSRFHPQNNTTGYMLARESGVGTVAGEITVNSSGNIGLLKSPNTGFTGGAGNTGSENAVQLTWNLN